MVEGDQGERGDSGLDGCRKLNLGCGQKKLGYISIDKFGEPDVRHDL